MLVLTRKAGESIRINDDITIVLLSIGEDRGRVGIKAPSNVKVHRNEVYERIKKDDESNNVMPPVSQAATKGVF